MKKLLLPLIPVILILGAYQALMVYDNRFPYGRMRETPAVKPHEEPILLMEPDIVPVTGGDYQHRATAAQDLLPPEGYRNPENISRGQGVYLTYCQQCHGRDHDGQGTVGQSFAPLPGDLRSPKVQGLSPGVIFKEISFGIPGGRQPALATTISAEERWTVTAYVQSLGLRP